MKIVLENLTKKFPNRNKGQADVVAVNDFSFEAPDGKLIGLLGPSGCGKSTMLNLISGLEPPTSGKIYFGEDDVTNLPPENRGIGLVFQSYALYPHLTVRQNILFPLQNLKGAAKLSKEVMEEKALEAAKLVQIENYMERKPSELSGGQQQRVAIARALVKMPRVLLLDEPLSNLDARLRLQTREEIRRIQKETGITTVFVTHDQEEAMSITDMIVVMKDGIKQQVGKPQEVYDNPANLFVAKFLGTPAINIFDGEVKDGKLIIGGVPVLRVLQNGGQAPEAAAESASALKDGPVTLGIRPEGFVLDPDGRLSCDMKAVEVMGRDVSIVCSHSAAVTNPVRAIIPSDSDTSCGARFSLKPGKVYLFNPETEERIFCSLAPLENGGKAEESLPEGSAASAKAAPAAAEKAAAYSAAEVIK